MPFWKNRVKIGVTKWEKANLNGCRHLIIDTNGNEYKGEWKDNAKHGKGSKFWKKSGAVYEGNWEYDKQNGFGILSVIRNGNYFRKYIGCWKDNKFQGYGTLCYFEKEYYEGYFKENLRHGWGKMHWANGDMYEGEWRDNKRHGRGMLDYANGQRVECHWIDDKKCGVGKHYFPVSGQLLLGFWVDDVCRTGTMEDHNWETALDPTPFMIPECGLENVADVTKDALKKYAQA